MRLCVISHSYVEQPGYLPALWAMARLPGVELSLITPDRYRAGVFSSEIFTDSQSSFSAFPVPIILGRRQGTFVYRASALGDVFDALKPEVLLHEQEVYSFGAAQIAALASRRSIPLAMFVWENVPRSLSLPRRRLAKFVMDRCAGFLAGSETAERLCRDWGFSGPVAVIPQMGVSSVDPHPKPGRRDVKYFQIGFAGRLVLEKGVDCLLRAVARMHAMQIAVHCTIAGDGPEMRPLRALAESLSIRELITMTGAISLADVGRLLQQIDVLVLPSLKTKTWEEQFGRILIEAMAKGTVTVGSKTGAIPEVIGSERLLFDEGDDAMLADRLITLASDEGLLKQQQAGLIQRVQNLYLNDVLAKKRVDFLSSLRTV